MPNSLKSLLPCPGCGGESTRVIGGPGTAGGPKHWAGCDHCRWRTWGNTEAEAITAWNTRAPIAEGGGGPYKEGQWGVLRGGDKMEHYVSVTECVDELNRLTAAIESLSRQGGEAVAYCNPSDPHARDAFSWPGTDRKPDHNTPLFTRASEAGAYDRDLIAKMLDQMLIHEGSEFSESAIDAQIQLLRAADNRDAAGVHTVHAAAPAPGGGRG